MHGLEWKKVEVMAAAPLPITDCPRMGIRRFLRGPARAILRLTGWRIAGAPPPIPRYVVIAAPHTSNWDGILMLLATTALQYPLNFLMKDSLFRGPLGPVARRLGGIAVDRRRSANTVEQIVAAFRQREAMALAIAPEGTRRPAECWRSGFYHIALQAGVPIVLGYIDYARREIGFGPVLWPTGDVRADMDRVRAFYADKIARHPERVGPIRLREELRPSGKR